jgi:hypothetical protein
MQKILTSAKYSTLSSRWRVAGEISLQLSTPFPFYSTTPPIKSDPSFLRDSSTSDFLRKDNLFSFLPRT